MKKLFNNERTIIGRLFLGIILLIMLCGFIGCGNKENEDEAKNVSYEVQFNSNGGSAVDSQSVQSGEKAEEPENPTKIGFTFIEWKYNDEKYDFDTEVTRDLVLVAYYEIEEGTEIVCIEFDSQGGSVLQKIEIAKESATSEPPEPTKQGYTFDGWYFGDEKFDFTTKITEDILLVARWSAVQSDTSSNSDNKSTNANDNSNNNSNNNSTDNDNQQNNTPSDSPRTYKFSDVKGKWYAEGREDITLEFVVEGSWVSIYSTYYDINSAKVNYLNSFSGGSEYYYEDGLFYTSDIELKETSLIHSKNGSSMTFYRKPDYPKHVENEQEKLIKAINGNYWYLDGYKYSYLYPTVEDWFDHQIMNWESENIDITNNTLTVIENLNFSEYQSRAIQASDNTHNELLANPLDSMYTLMTKYSMKVENGKLYMTIGGKKYCFTKCTSRKPIEISFSIDKTNIIKSIGEEFSVTVQITPHFALYDLALEFSDPSVVSSTYNNSIVYVDGKIILSFDANNVGTTKVTVKDKKTGANSSFNVTVQSVKATGISLNKSSIELTKGVSEELTASVVPNNATQQDVEWSSSSTSVATVSSTGKVTAVGFGTATITAKPKEGSCTATCNVTVKELPLKITASIGTSINFVGNTMTTGVSVDTTTTGGSEQYVTYSIKLYYNNTLIGESANKSLFVAQYKSGTYRAEVYVKDSNGKEATHSSTVVISN